MQREVAGFVFIIVSDIKLLNAFIISYILFYSVFLSENDLGIGNTDMNKTTNVCPHIAYS